METVETAAGGLRPVNIERFPTIRAGIEIEFRGQDVQRDAEGKIVLDENDDPIPISEFVDIKLIVPPLDLDSMREFEKPLQKLAEVTPSEALETLQKAVKRALCRNYRRVPNWLIRTSFDVGNLEELSRALMDINGMHRKELEAGKAKAAAG